MISIYSEQDNAYVILWEDYRSTGKEFCANLYGLSYSSTSCNLGDMNIDGTNNVLDVVLLVNCVLAENCEG